MSSLDPEDQEKAGADAADAEQKPVDLRFTKVEHRGVRVERDMSGQGHLARGSRTNMSNMRFSMRTQPREELDPELQALRPAEAMKPAAFALPTALPTALPDAIPTAVPTAVPPAGPPGLSESRGGMFAAIKRMFS